MRTTIKRSTVMLALVLAALVPMRAFAQPGGSGLPFDEVLNQPFLTVRAQQGGPPETPSFLPTWVPERMDSGFYVGGEFIMFRQSNPMQPQFIAQRGFITTIDAIGNLTTTVGGFIGSGTPALNSDFVSGDQYGPGFKMDIGYRFADGSTITVDWMYLFNTHKTGGATFAAKDFQVRQDFADAFLTAAVFNFAPEFSGPDDILDAAGNVVPGAAIGIWNAASIMTLEFQQRTQKYDITYRTPYYEDECTRMSCEVGARFFWIWERFRWRTVDLDVNNVGGDFNTAVYSNVVSNRMYGVHIGQSCERYLGNGFAVQFDVGAALLLDVVKERAKYELQARFTAPQSKRARSDFTMVPELTGSLSLVWYPKDGIQVRAGYNAMTFFNTVAFDDPVNFDFLGLDVKYRRYFRLFDGLDVGVGFIF